MPGQAHDRPLPDRVRPGGRPPALAGAAATTATPARRRCRRAAARAAARCAWFPRVCVHSNSRTPTFFCRSCPARATATVCPSRSVRGRPGSRLGPRSEPYRWGCSMGLRVRQVVAGEGRLAAASGGTRQADLRRGLVRRHRGPPAGRAQAEVPGPPATAAWPRRPPCCARESRSSRTRRS